MTDRVRIGVVGTSGYTDHSHLARLKSHPAAELAAICGRNRGRAEELARKHAIPQVFTDYREMIERGRLDAIVVAAPDDLHYPITMAALDAGLHVLCEKPLALDAGQARAMYEKAEAVGVKHMTCFTNRWLPHSRYLKQLVDQGYLGRLFHCNIRFLASFSRSPNYMWRFDRHQGTGVLGDVGSHMIDLARWFAGDISRVAAHLGVYVDHRGPEGQEARPANDAAMLALEFANGAQGSIQLSAVALTGERGHERQIALYGESGTLELSWDAVGGNQLRGFRQGEERFRELTVPDELWQGVNREQPEPAQVSDVFTRQSVADRQFVDAILTDQPITPGFYEGLRAQEVIDAAIRSHEDGRWVAV